ncbi:hypothetical protein GIB67_022325, partial [Kingdonia uniflora]
MQPTIFVGYLFINNAHLIWESLCKVYSQRENNVRIFQLSNEIGNFKQASAPSENVHIPPTATKICAKIVEKTWVFQFLAGLNPDFEFARVHLLDMIPFTTLEEAHIYCLSDQNRRSPMPPISGIPSETSAMTVRYAYLAPPSVPSQTSHTLSLSLFSLLGACGNSRPPKKKCNYCVRQILRQDEINRFRQLLSMSSTSAASHARNFASVNNIYASLTSSWIVDSGATDNLT